MSNWKPYINPPIVEALIDIQVTPEEGVTLDDCDSLRLEVADSYPHVERLSQAVGTMVLKGGEAIASASNRDLGLRFSNAEQSYVWQVRLDRFTLSRLPPYENWGNLLVEAKRLWAIYKKAVRPISIERMAVRVINRIDLPGNRVDLEEYFRFFPEIPSELPAMLGLLTQVKFGFPELKSLAILHQTWLPPAQPGVISIALDIDIFQKETVAADDKLLWQTLSDLREKRNTVFEACITDKCRELFK